MAVEVIEENQRTTEQQLASMRLTTVEGELTVLGVLVLANDPRQFVPGAYIQFLRIEGTELTDPIKNQKEIFGPLSDLLRMLDETFQVNISVASDITAQPVEIRQPDYPLVRFSWCASPILSISQKPSTAAPTYRML